MSRRRRATRIVKSADQERMETPCEVVFDQLEALARISRQIQRHAPQVAHLATLTSKTRLIENDRLLSRSFVQSTRLAFFPAFLFISPEAVRNPG